MFLTEAGVVHYLVEQRFADIADVVGGELRVHGISRRNLNFRVAAGKRQYLVKQVRKWDADGRASIEREAAVYWQAKTNPALAPVAALAPECHAWDPGSAILILEYLPAHTDLFDLADRFNPAVARLAGKAMGCFHRAMRDEKHREQFPAEIPWYVSMQDIHPDDPKDETLHILDEDSQHEARLDLPLNFQNGSVEGPGVDLRTGPAPVKQSAPRHFRS